MHGFTVTRVAPSLAAANVLCFRTLAAALR
jgi:hypothetical protein